MRNEKKWQNEKPRVTFLLSLPASASLYAFRVPAGSPFPYSAFGLAATARFTVLSHSEQRDASMTGLRCQGQLS